MLSESNFPTLKKSISASNSDGITQKPVVMKYSDVLKQKKANVNNALKFSEVVEKETKNDFKTDLLINNISEKTEKFTLDNKKSPIESNAKPQSENNLSKSNKNDSLQINKKEEENKEEIQKKYQNNVDTIVKIQKWWRMVSTIKSMNNISKDKANQKKEKENVTIKTLPKKPSFSEIVKLTPPSSPINTEKPTINNNANDNSNFTTNNNNTNNNSNNNNNKKLNKRNRRNNKNRNNFNNNNNNEMTPNNDINNEAKAKENEKKNQVNNKKVNEELNTIYKNMKFMGLVEKEIDDLTEKNTAANGKQFAKTKVVTVKRYSRNSSSSNFSLDDLLNKENEAKKKGNKNENKSNDKKGLAKKKSVCFNEKDEVFNEYNHVMKKLDLQRRCDKKSCLIDCYRRLYKREWEEDEISGEESSSSISTSSESGEENSETTLAKKSDYLYNDIYNPNYTKYYSGSDFDFGNRYFTGKERLKKALHLEPVEITVQKIIYQPIKFQRNKRYQPKKKNGNKKKQRN